LKKPDSSIYENEAEKAFTKQSSLFDDIYSSNTIIQYKRKRVRDHVEKFLKPNSFILEINAGTGEDALYFAENDHRIHATDISPGMLEVLAEKTKVHNMTDKISTELCSYTELETLSNRGPYDLIFSNFAGLNCTPELDKVLNSFAHLLKPDGMITLVLLPEFCLWETLLLFKGKFKTAFRRFFSGKGAKAHIEGQYFKCWYYNPSYIIRRLKNSFEIQSLEGLCTIVPPSYIEHFAEKYPDIYEFLKKKEERLKDIWPWKSIGDYYILTMKKVDI
jgi:ubiquinone/menaquinone biosynthesis C-methylase UbiE